MIKKGDKAGEEKIPELINKHIAAKLLNVSTRTLSNYRKQGLLTGYRVLNVVKYSRENIIQLINNSKI